jgi:hypothetical protein
MNKIRLFRIQPILATTKLFMLFLLVLYNIPILQTLSWHHKKERKNFEDFYRYRGQVSGRHLSEKPQYTTLFLEIKQSNYQNKNSTAPTSADNIAFYARGIHLSAATLLLLYFHILFVPATAAEQTIYGGEADQSVSVERLRNVNNELQEHARWLENEIESDNGQSDQHRNHWILGNGEVTLPDVIQISGLKLTHPKLLGSGAGGAVFTLKQEQNQHFDVRSSGGDKPAAVALKVSWSASAKDVRNECRILRHLQHVSEMQYGTSIHTIEMCLAEAPYQLDPSRTMIALQPVFTDNEATSLHDFLSEPDKMEVAITQIIQTMLQMLSANVVTIDVQPLISSETGQILFVDFTEAMIIHKDDGTFDDKEKVVIRNFINEMMVLIPIPQQDTIASDILLRELLHYPIHSYDIIEALLEQNYSMNALDQIKAQMHFMMLL